MSSICLTSFMIFFFLPSLEQEQQSKYTLVLQDSIFSTWHGYSLDCVVTSAAAPQWLLVAQSKHMQRQSAVDDNEHHEKGRKHELFYAEYC